MNSQISFMTLKNVSINLRLILVTEEFPLLDEAETI